ncbi:MAG: PHP domain-containing protein, partial [Asgard group archaeon]|nr:PHP domain-containing protein [Asgard group archaeon]
MKINQQTATTTKNSKKEIDLHLHTTASDGTFTPSEMVKFAKVKGLSAIAITDHDTVNGVPEAIYAGKKEKLEVISGIEFSTEYHNQSIHIVGLFVDYLDKELLKLTKEIVQSRKTRAIKMIEKINALDEGNPLTIQEIEKKADGLIGKLHIANTMVEKGYADTIDEIFEKYLKRDAKCYVPRFKLSPKQAIEFLNKKKAIPILAHPGLYDFLDLKQFLIKHKSHGLKGIEVYYPSHSPKYQQKLKELAKELNLCVSGGSDCHGEVNNDPLCGSLHIPYK